ncbi:uncharacterized protein [Paramisgurnus dabryanus]|uniref:uncharacterized protein n=1 Tax=Paramisgurnus dabryanus TaxID=90735 RepID=UPI0031F3C803
MKLLWICAFLLMLRVTSYQTLKFVSAVIDQFVVLPCDSSGCAAVQWSQVNHIQTTIAGCHNHRCSVEESFKDRFKFIKENSSLLLISAKYNDQGTYRCTCDGIKNDVKLEVLVPVNVSAKELANITLPCYAGTLINVNDVTWLHNNSTVLHYYKNGSMSFGKGYEGRVSLTRDGFRYGDLSLTLTEVNNTDAGLYRCFLHDETTKGDPHSYMLHVNGKMGDPDVPLTNPGGNQNSEVNYLLRGAIIIIIIVLFAIIVILSVLLYKRRTTASPTDVNHPLTSDISSQPRKSINGFLSSSL